MGIKLPEWQASARPNVRMRSAAFRSSPTPMAAPQQRFIPEVTSDQVTSQALTQARATGQVVSAIGNTLGAYLTKQKRLEAQISEVEARTSADAAMQAYQRRMYDYKATRILGGANLERSAADGTGLGFTETRQWESLGDDYVSVSNSYFNEIKDTYLSNPEAERYFSAKRLTFDKQNLDDIYKHQRDQQIDLATARVKEANHMDVSEASIRERTEAAIKAGLPAQTLMEDADKNIKRVNFEALTTVFTEFQMGAALTNENFYEYDEDKLAGIWSGMVEGFSMVRDLDNPADVYRSVDQARRNGVTNMSPLLNLPEGAQENLFKMYNDSLTFIEERDKRRSQAHYKDVLQKSAQIDNPTWFWEAEINKPGAKDLYGEYYDDIVALYNTAHREGTSDQNIVGQLEMLIRQQAGYTSEDDYRIRATVTHWRGQEKVSKSDFSRLLGQIDSKESERRTRSYQLAEELIRAAIVGPNMSDSALENYFNSEFGSKVRGRFMGALRKLERFRSTNRDGDLVVAAENIILDTVRLEPWMVDYDGKTVSGRGRVMDINTSLSRDALNKEIDKRLEAQAEGGMSSEFWEQDAREKLRRIEAIQMMMTELQTTDPNAEIGSNYLEDTWIPEYTPDLQYE